MVFYAATDAGQSCVAPLPLQYHVEIPTSCRGLGTRHQSLILRLETYHNECIAHYAE